MPFYRPAIPPGFQESAAGRKGANNRGMRKSSRIRLISRGLIVIALLALLAGAGLVVFLSVTELHPPRHRELSVEGTGVAMDTSRGEFTLLTWNIGYAGLGAGQDFFYDGGRMVRPSKEMWQANFGGIRERIKGNDSVDFILLQEVDRNSKRSWFSDELAGLGEVLPGFSRTFSVSYDCRYIPVPLFEPMGRMLSGIALFSRFRPEKAETGYYGTEAGWPKRLVYLKRCYILLRYDLGRGKQLVLINTHNSAYDSSGVMRIREMTMLDSLMKAEYARGRYVIAGGDWNINPRGFDPQQVTTGDAVSRLEPPVPAGLFRGWEFAFDHQAVTNRNVNESYSKGSVGTTVIDFFVVSPNLEVTAIKTLPEHFSFSDHEPVRIRVKIK